MDGLHRASTKLRFSDLTSRQIALLKGGCGVGATALFIPQFIFQASCTQHDFYYRRGGWFFDKLEADVFFYAYMLKDIGNCGRNVGIKCLYLCMATLYFLLVSVFGIFAFSWGRYKTFTEILRDRM